MTADTIHTCSYSCERPGCIRAQRDELVAKVEALRAEVEGLHEQLRLATVDQATAEAEANDARAENERLAELRYRLETANAYGQQCDEDIRRLQARVAELEAENEALRAEVERLRADRDSWEQQASDRVADWYAEHLRAERLAEALREWWSAHRPVGWTEDQHRACPHVNLATDAEKALATALLRDQEEGK